MKTPLIAIEVYRTASEAVAALAAQDPDSQRAPLSEFPPYLSLRHDQGVVCIRYNYDLWSQDAGRLETLLPELTAQLSSQRVVVDFADQRMVGTPTMACLYAVRRHLTKVSGRLAYCNLQAELLEFLQGYESMQSSVIDLLPCPAVSVLGNLA